MKYQDLKWKLANVLYRSGVLNYEAEEVIYAEKALSASLRLLDPSLDEPLVLQLIDTYNYLTMIHFQHEDFEKAEQSSTSAETLYANYLKTLAGSDKIPSRKLEKLYTMTVFYLAQVYGRMENTAKSAFYCQLTLLRHFASGDYDPQELAPFCLQIATYYQTESRWYQALYVIGAAATLAKTLPNAKQLEAEIALFMAKFYADYIASQHDRSPYLPTIAEEVTEFKGLVLDASFVRPSLAPLATDLQVDSWLSDGSAWFDKALSYFVLDGFTTEHVDILLERDTMLSIGGELFSDKKRKKSLLRRRLATLEPLLTTLSPNHFFTLIQQLLFTIGEICERLVDLSSLPFTDGLSSTDSQATCLVKNYEEKVKKLNKVVVTGVQYFQRFLDTILPEGRLPPSLDDGVVESFFRAHLSLAKLHQRFRSSNRKVLAMMTRKAASYYQLIDSLGRAYKPPMLSREIAMCKELHQLLSLKADAIEKNTPP